MTFPRQRVKQTRAHRKKMIHRRKHGKRVHKGPHHARKRTHRAAAKKK